MWKIKHNLLNTKTASNPRYLIPTIAWRSNLWRTKDGKLAHIGSIAFMWFRYEFWFSLYHSVNYETWKEELCARRMV